MSDLLLTHGYFLFEDKKEILIMRPSPTLGLLYVSAYLRRAGFEVEVFDSTFASRQELLDRLAAGSGVVGIHTNLLTRRPVLDVVAVAKRRGWIVVLGGPESAKYPLEYLRSGADVIVTGEGEATLVMLNGEIRFGDTHYVRLLAQAPQWVECELDGPSKLMDRALATLLIKLEVREPGLQMRRASWRAA
jgi:radical SAM superfamily enzyme YgiQ (UPF0313 family)